MTDEQKRLSLRMRNAGQSYAEIASALGVPCGSVKSYTSRHNGDYSAAAYCDDAESLRSELDDAVSTSFIQNNTVVCESAPNRYSNGSLCRHCGKPLNLHNGNHMKRFCSENCRQKWWRAHKGELTDRASTSVCVGCGIIFKNGGNPNRRYCSRDCYFNHRFYREGAV